MRARTLLAVLAVTAVGACAAMSIRSVCSTRTRKKKLDKEALSRWEDEGGPPPPVASSAPACHRGTAARHE
jgi:hypothetical protein